MNRPENKDCELAIMNSLDNMLRSTNPFAHAFKKMHQIELAESTKAAEENRAIKPVRMIFSLNANTDSRRYNEPTGGEIALVFVGEEGEPHGEIDFTVHPIVTHLQTLTNLSPNADPIVYPLLFPYGEKGW